MIGWKPRLLRRSALFFAITAGLLGNRAGAEPNAEAYPTPASKKGLQVQMLDDGLQLGIKHAALNCHLASFVALAPEADSLRWQSDGQDYFFKAREIQALDARIKPLSDAGVVVSLILLNYENRDEALNALFLHPNYARGAAPERMSAFNTVTADGTRQLRAVVEFLAARYSAADAAHGRVWNYIVGNEVDSHWWWNNQGRATAAEVASDYEHAVRLVHTAVRRASRHARVFVSLDHHWTIRYPAGAADQTCSGRELLETFARLARERGDFDWHVAYHPYPENLGEPRFWLDQSAPPNEDAPLITFKNLEVLPRFLQRPELRFAGQPRRIILSEQGFHCPDRPDGERDQAAAFCAAWWKVAHLEGIDAFILHRHVDHSAEGGLNLGLWTRQPTSIATPDRPRQMHELFRLADTPAWEKAFAFALPIIGISRWEELAK